MRYQVTRECVSISCAPTASAQRRSNTLTDTPIGEDAALIIVDVQNDFCPGGALPVPFGEQVVLMLNEYIRRFVRAGARVYATRDWHPVDHTSFIANGGPWPPHCIQRAKGAEFHEDLHLPRDATIISKADAERDAYSGFDGTGLEEQLKRHGIRTVFVGGLATEYCVKQTVMDASRRGFATFVLVDAIRGLSQRESARAIEEMLAKGAQRATRTSITSSLC